MASSPALPRWGAGPALLCPCHQGKLFCFAQLRSGANSPAVTASKGQDQLSLSQTLGLAPLIQTTSASSLASPRWGAGPVLLCPCQGKINSAAQARCWVNFPDCSQEEVGPTHMFSSIQGQLSHTTQVRDRDSSSKLMLLGPAHLSSTVV